MKDVVHTCSLLISFEYLNRGNGFRVSSHNLPNWMDKEDEEMEDGVHSDVIDKGEGVTSSSAREHLTQWISWKKCDRCK